jgi:hypothetical protein
MTKTTNTNSNNADHIPELDLELIRPDLEQLAKETVNKTLKQAQASSIDPVLRRSSALATYYMMMPRNDGLAQEQVLDIIARHVEGLTVISTGLKFGIDPKYIDLIQSNDPANIASLLTDYDPEPRGPTYRPDALIINQQTGKACLVDFKRQVATIETTKLNRIADNLTIARAQVRDFLYKKYNRVNVEEDATSWAIIDCSDQELLHRFQGAGVFGLESLDAICGIKNIAAAYRIARKFMAAEFNRGEAELMAQSNRYIPAKDVEALIEAAVNNAQIAMAADLQRKTAIEAGLGTIATADSDDFASDEPVTDQVGTILPFPHEQRQRRIGMFGT